MNTSEKIASVVAQFIAADREEDRKRIAELERDKNHAVAQVCLIAIDVGCSDYTQTRESVLAFIADLNKQLDELNEKCAALVVERNQLTVENNHLHADNNRLTKSLGVGNPYGPGLVDKAPTLRIDADMSNPQPGKLLVVRLDDDDVGRAWMLTSALHRERREDAQPFWPSQFVGFLVETPAVEVQGPWVVYDETCDGECFGGRSGLATPYWSPSLKDCATFDTHEEAESSMRHSRFAKTSRVITLAEARAIEAKR